MTVEKIAQTCHELNRAYCQSIGDNSQPSWEDAPEWQRSSAINGVNFHLANPNAGTSDSHDSWLKQKEEEGWKYGPVKNPETKEHPCFVPYDQLPNEQKAKDFIFRQTVHSLKDQLTPPEIFPQLIKTLVEKSRYEVPLFRVTDTGLECCDLTDIRFCKGNKEDPSVPRQTGFFTETLIAVCVQYLKENNVGDLASRETSTAITQFEQGLMWLGKRAADRKARGVQGTYQK
jgi:hypothetical protein